MVDSRPDNPSPQEIEVLLRSRAARIPMGQALPTIENASSADQKIATVNREIRAQSLRQPQQSTIATETEETEELTGEEETGEQGITAISQETRMEKQKGQARNQREKGTEDVIKEQVVKQAKKRIWLWIAGLTVLNPMFWLVLLIGFGIAIMLFAVTLAYSCYQQMGISGIATTAFSAWWSEDPAGAIMDAVTNKCFKISGASQAANATASQTTKTENTGESGSAEGTGGTKSPEDEGSPN